MKDRSLIFMIPFFVFVTGVFFLSDFNFRNAASQPASVARIVSSPFIYNFKIDGVLDETGNMDDSPSPYWWLNSGGQFYLRDGIGKTLQGKLSEYYRWRLTYFNSNSIDTDDGYRPQNIFRLVTRSKWQNFQQKVYFRIVKINMSDSPNRNAWSGILLFNRYFDENNLYYTGIRTDGAAVIKKKTEGKYYTMAYKQFYFADARYDRDTNPNLIPGKRWIGIKNEIINNPDNTVGIKFFIDKENNGNWELVLEAKDDGKSYGGNAILDEGYAGIRTDFMDAEFDNYRIVEI